MANGNGDAQGWFRLLIQVVTITAGAIWIVSQLTTRVEVLDARMSGKMAALERRVDDQNAVIYELRMDVKELRVNTRAIRQRVQN